MGTNYYWKLPEYGLDVDGVVEKDNPRVHIGKFSGTRPVSTFYFAQSPELVELVLKLLPQDKVCAVGGGQEFTPPQMRAEIESCGLHNLSLGMWFS